MKRVDIRRLPEDPSTIGRAGPLYLPLPYVVPGGRFNEMYGWDSYFTLLGLIRDGELQLASTVPVIDKYCAYWMRQPHFTPESGLSRYYGGASTPAPEALHGERDKEGKTHYDRVRDYYRTHEVNENNVDEYYDRAADQLKPLFYIGDRAVRESGLDPIGSFWPFQRGHR